MNAPAGFSNSSLLAPLLVAVRDRPGTELAFQMLITAADSVPDSVIVRKVPAGRKSAEAAYVRGLRYGNAPEEDAYSYVVRCSDRPGPGVTGPEDVHWDARMIYLPVEPYQDQLTGASHAVRLDVTSFHLRREAVVAAAQLALFRHLWVRCYQAVDAELFVQGRHDWQSHWWIPAGS